MPDLNEVYQATEPAPIPDALSEAATAIRKAFTDRAAKYGAEDPEAIRLMGCHKAVIQLRNNYEPVNE